MPSSAPTNRRSAADSLSTFFSSAGVLDRQLKEAAAAINASGPPWTAANPGVAQKVRAAKLAPVAGAIPAGMSHDLLQSVVLVLSDLTSRRYAMGSFEFQPPDPYANLLRELRNGHPAAARYADDVAAARALARSTAPLAPVPGSSRRTAEVLLLVRYVTLANGGCGSRGGTVLTRLPEVVWGPVTRNPEADGTVGGVAFSADLDSDGRWQVNLFAC
ncbi:hypothetical protein GCM10022235_74230 [Kribbella ginsengisoli]|uniref:Gluconate 2-dehydrogenase subunit 3-like protein n=1 Tax=Kribbella ginsengisoli TaxID=363865 RepID=A0ABP6YZV7_9ACTN